MEDSVPSFTTAPAKKQENTSCCDKCGCHTKPKPETEPKIEIVVHPYKRIPKYRYDYKITYNPYRTGSYSRYNRYKYLYYYG